MELSDLKNHLDLVTEETKPISLKFKGQNFSQDMSSPTTEGLKDQCVEVWEHSLNSQGIVALMALKILEQLEYDRKIPTFQISDHNTVTYLHAIIAFADGSWWITDPTSRR